MQLRMVQLVVSLASLILILGGCGKGVEAYFTYKFITPNCDTLLYPDCKTIQTSNISSNSNEFEWDYPGCNDVFCIVKEKNPEFTFLESGVYEVKLTSYSKNGKKYDTHIEQINTY